MVVVNFLRNALLIGLCIGVSLIALLYKQQEKLLYMPEPGVGVPRQTSENSPSLRDPSVNGLKYENVFIKTVDGAIIHAWLILHKTNPGNVPTIVYFHGNAGNIGHRMQNLVEMMEHLDTNILMVEYRGYGDSNSKKALSMRDELPEASDQAIRRAESILSRSKWGKIERDSPSEIGIKFDAISALDFLLHFNDPQHSKNDIKIDPNRIFLFGRSLGGAVSLSLLSSASALCLPNEKHFINGVILENTFLSVPEMARELMPALLGGRRKKNANPRSLNLLTWLFALIRKYLVHMKWDNELLLSSDVPLSSNVLFISGRKDEIVPTLHMDSLFQLATDNKEKLDLNHVVKFEVKDGTHNDTWLKGGASYYMAIKKFMSDSMDSYDLVSKQK